MKTVINGLIGRLFLTNILGSGSVPLMATNSRNYIGYDHVILKQKPRLEKIALSKAEKFKKDDREEQKSITLLNVNRFRSK